MPDKPESPGAALVRKRWDKTTPEERSELGRKLALRRWELEREGLQVPRVKRKPRPK